MKNKTMDNFVAIFGIGKSIFDRVKLQPATKKPGINIIAVLVMTLAKDN